MVYMLAGCPLQWGLEADSPEEAHAKFKGMAARFIGSWNDPENTAHDPRIRKEIVKVMRNKFQVEPRPDLKEGWSDPPRWARK